MKSLAEICREYSTPHYVVNVKKKDERNLQNFSKKVNSSTNLVICNAWHWKISSVFLDTVKEKVYNCHSSLLPDNAGGSGIKLPLLRNQKYTGVTLHRMTQEYDSGEILHQLKIKISANENYFSLYKKISIHTSILIEQGIERVMRGSKHIPNRISKIYPKISLFRFFLIKFGIVSKRNTFNNLYK